MMIWLLIKKNTLYAHRIIHFEILNHFAAKQTLKIMIPVLIYVHLLHAFYTFRAIKFVTCFNV